MAQASTQPVTASSSPEGLPDLVALADEAQSSLTRLTPKPPVNFRFRWQGLNFAAQVRENDGKTSLRLLGDLGPIPFSAEGMAARRTLMELVQWTGGGNKCRFTIDRHQHLTLLGEAPVAAPLTGGAIIASAVQFLLQATPYIALAGEQRARAATA